MALRPPLVLEAGEKQQHQPDDTLEVRSNAALATGLPTGGIITTDGAFTVHTFLSGDTFTVPAGLILENVEVLIVGGGGGGGSGYTGNGNGAGGGAGGIVNLTGLTFVPFGYAINVGVGGAGGQDNSGLGHPGNGSSIDTIGAADGGGGGAGSSSISVHTDNGGAGGSGGGGNGGYGGAGGGGTIGQGNPGGAGATAFPFSGGGGGGKSAAGSAAGAGTFGQGGAGQSYSISGAAVTYGGGGGGGANSGSGNGGAGGGGDGGGGAHGVNGTANRGGGGGGGGNLTPANGGVGGSGVVIIRYRTPTVAQSRLSYDASNYQETSVNSTGRVIVNAVGTAVSFLWLLNGVLLAKWVSGLLSFVGELSWTGTAWTAYTPTITAGTASPTTLGTVTGRYKVYGKTVFLHLRIDITTNGSASTFLSATLPIPATSGFVYILAGRETIVSGAMVQGRTGTAAGLQIRKYDNSYPGGDGTSILVSGIYEID